jgi:hypothetical protein
VMVARQNHITFRNLSYCIRNANGAVRRYIYNTMQAACRYHKKSKRSFRTKSAPIQLVIVKFVVDDFIEIDVMLHVQSLRKYPKSKTR